MTSGASLIVERLGRDDAQALSDLVGGTRLFVPITTGPPPTGGRNGFARLVRLLGHRLAVKVVLHFGDSRLYVPRSAPRKPVDPKAVIRLTRKGRSAAQIARALNCSDRTVHAIRTRTSPRTDGHRKLGIDQGNEQ